MKTKTLIMLSITLASGLALRGADSMDRNHVLDEARAGRAATVEVSLESLAAVTPPDADALSELGELRMRQGRAKEAVEVLEKAAQAQPKSAEIQARLGSALSMRMPDLSFMHRAMAAGRMFDAFKKAVELDPEHIPGRIGLLRYYSQAPAIAGGSFEKAEEQGRELAKRNPYLAEIEFGMLRERQDDFDGAVAHYRKAQELKPDSIPAMVREARALVKLDRSAEAVVVLNRAHELDPANENVAKTLAELSTKI